VKEIPLARGLVALVDDEDFIWLSVWPWRPRTSPGGFVYAARGGPRGKVVFMHREIIKRTGVVEFQDTDHADRDTLNNCRSNLRPATRTQNNFNQGKKWASRTRPPASIYKGVTYYQGRVSPWCARIKGTGRVLHLGYYRTEIEAAHAYDRGARRVAGPFARLNFPASQMAFSGQRQAAPIRRRASR
jgi:hypothetical protein